MRLLLATLMMICTTAQAALVVPGSDAARARLDPVAEAYVHLSLEIGEREAGYVDAYYGPDAWAEQAKRAPRPLAELRQAAEALLEQLRRVDETGLQPLELRRKRLLSAQLVSARTRMAMIAGESLDFESEAEGLYALRPQLKPLASYDPVIDRLDAALPGEGPLWQRVDRLTAAT
ncbi:MAG: hypothetical protein EOP91_14560, partial [Lysobacteraceae bacterium]